MAQIVEAFGQRLEFPDDMPREQIAQAIKSNELQLRRAAGLDPTSSMGTVERLRAGAGRGMASAARGVGNLLGLVSDEDMAEAKRLDAALMDTTAGKVGNVVGMAGVAVPTALIPGANTYMGASLIGAGLGGATTEGDALERVKGAAFGAAGGAAGKFLGDKLAAGTRWAADRARTAFANNQLANAQKNAAAQQAAQAGYVIPPADLNRPGMFTEALSGLSGKIKTAQVASQRNQQVSNSLARQALGITDDAPLTVEALDAFRRGAAQPYREIAGMGDFAATGAKLPASVNVKSGINPLVGGKTQTVDAAELVRAWKQSNHDATGYFRAYGRDANPETLAKAHAAAATAKQIDDFLADSLTNAGKGESLAALKDARRQIAKSYTVEKALNSQTGDVSAQVLAKELAKGKPLSGELRQIAEAGQAFPKALQALKEAPKQTSPLDWAFGVGTAAGTGNPLAMLAMGARPAARELLLSPVFQRAALREAGGPGLLSQLPAEFFDQALTRRAAPGVTGLLTARGLLSVEE